VSVADQVGAQAAEAGLELGERDRTGGEEDEEGAGACDGLRRALVAGCFLNVARRLPGGEGGGRPTYRTIVGGITASIHPASALILAHAPARDRAAAAAARAGRGAGAGGARGSAPGAAHAAALAVADSLAGYPDTVVFSELVQSGGTGSAGGSAEGESAGAGRWRLGVAARGPVVYMRTVSRVETSWLSTVRPDFFAAHSY
jgi:hypothetical protein